MRMVNLSIIGYPKYSVTSDGEVWSDYKKGFLKPQKNTQGYYHVSLCNLGTCKTHCIHKLVGLAFNFSKWEEGHHCHHKDGDIYNNSPCNLEWLSPEDHVKRGWELGQLTCKYTEKVFLNVRKCLQDGYSDKEVALKLKLPLSLVKDFRTGKLKTQESEKVEYRGFKRKTRLSPEQLEEVSKLLSEGLIDADIARITGIKRKTVNRLRSGSFYKELLHPVDNSKSYIKSKGRLTKEDVFNIMERKDSHRIIEIAEELGLNYDKVKGVIYEQSYKKVIDQYKALKDKEEVNL